MMNDRSLTLALLAGMLVACLPADAGPAAGDRATRDRAAEVLAFDPRPNPPWFPWPPTRALDWTLRDVPSGQSVDAMTHLVQQAFALWSTVHPGTFTQVAADAPQRHQMLEIQFAKRDGPAEDRNGDGVCVPADGERGCDRAGTHSAREDLDTERSTIVIDEEEPLCTDPARRDDCLVLLVHEIGHVLGLGHSDREGAIMYPRYQRGIRPVLSEDDRLAVRAQSAVWHQVATPAPVADVHGTPLAIVTADGGIYRASADGFTRVEGSGKRIAADVHARLWVVRADGSLHAQRGDDGSWVKVAGPCATDVGVSQAGGVWIVGCDGGLYRAAADASASDTVLARDREGGFVRLGPADGFVSIAGRGAGALAVDRDGALHELDALGLPSPMDLRGTAYPSPEFHRTGQGPQVVHADARSVADVGAALAETVWAGGFEGRGVYALNVQDEVPGTQTYAQQRWVGYDERDVRRVSVDARGRPLVVDAEGRLFTTSL